MEKYAVPGVYSAVGKTTHRSLHRLRTLAEATNLSKPESPKAQELPGEGEIPPKEAVDLLRQAQALGARRIGKGASSASALSNSIDGGASRRRPSAKLNIVDSGLLSDAAPVAMASPLNRSLKGAPSPVPSPTNASFTYPQTPTAGKEPLRLTLHLRDKEAVAPPVRPSPAFVSHGMQKEVYCESARAQFKRFVAPAQHKNPELGRYAATHTLVHERSLSCTFGMREKHSSRKVAEDLPDNCLGPESLLENCFSRSASASTLFGRSKYSLEQMSVQTPRPELSKIAGIKLHEVSCPAVDKDDQDKKTSVIPRSPTWDIGIYLPRKDLVKKDFWEPGKYEIQYTAVQNQPRTGMGFEREMSREERSKTTPIVKGILRKEGLATQPDRGLYRGGPQVRERIKNVRNMSQDTDRPPLTKRAAVYYDESNPEVVSATLKREMEFDSSTVDHAVVSRRDQCISMGRSLARDQALRGSRVFQGDISMRASQGLMCKDTVSEMECSVAQCKEAPNRLRQGRFVPFRLMAGRKKNEATPAFSPLRQPRDNCAPDFARIPPQRGYHSSMDFPAMAVPWHERAHEPMPAWDASEWDEGDSLQSLLPGQSAKVLNTAAQLGGAEPPPGSGPQGASDEDPDEAATAA